MEYEKIKETFDGRTQFIEKYRWLETSIPNIKVRTLWDEKDDYTYKKYLVMGEFIKVAKEHKTRLKFDLCQNYTMHPISKSIDIVEGIVISIKGKISIDWIDTPMKDPAIFYVGFVMSCEEDGNFFCNDVWLPHHIGIGTLKECLGGVKG